MQYACELSLHELIEKYKLLPEQLTNDEGQYLDEYQGEFDEQYDNYLDQLTQIYQSPLQNEMDEMWGEYVVKNGVEPLYVDCRIRENGSSPEDKNVIIKLSLDKENKVSIDDNTFCHCNSLDELKLLAVKSDEDFVIIEIHSFQYEP